MKLQLQALPVRDVPAALIFANGSFWVTGSAAQDVVSVYDRGAEIEVVARFGSAPVQTMRQSDSAVNRIVFRGGLGADSFSNLSDKLSIAYGESGNDILQGGSGSDVLLGGAGNDILRGRAGNDYLDGGVGYDDLDGGTEHDWLLTEKYDKRSVNGRNVTANLNLGLAFFDNGPTRVAVPLETRLAEASPNIPFQAVHETSTLSPELLSGILFPVFVGR